MLNRSSDSAFGDAGNWDLLSKDAVLRCTLSPSLESSSIRAASQHPHITPNQPAPQRQPIKSLEEAPPGCTDSALHSLQLVSRKTLNLVSARPSSIEHHVPAAAGAEEDARTGVGRVSPKHPGPLRCTHLCTHPPFPKAHARLCLRALALRTGQKPGRLADALSLPTYNSLTLPLR